MLLSSNNMLYGNKTQFFILFIYLTELYYIAES